MNGRQDVVFDLRAAMEHGRPKRVMKDFQRASRQISRSLLLQSSDVTVYYHQARLVLLQAHKRYVKSLQAAVLKSGARVKAGAEALFATASTASNEYTLEIKALEVLKKGLGCLGPVHALPHGRGHHLPSLLLRGRILLQILTRRDLPTLSYVQKHPELLRRPDFAPQSSFWESQRSQALGGCWERESGGGTFISDGQIQKEMLQEAEECFRRIVLCLAKVTATPQLHLTLTLTP